MAAVGGEPRRDPQLLEECADCRVSLKALLCQTAQHHLCAGAHHGDGVPVGRRAPVGLDAYLLVGVSLLRNADDALPVVPHGLDPELAHAALSHPDVGLAPDFAGQLHLETALKGRGYHHQRRDELTADVARYGYLPAVHRATLDAQGRVALFLFVFNPGTQRTKCLHQNPDGTLLHPLRPRDVVDSGPRAEECRQEAHRRACRADVDMRQVRVQGGNHHPRVVAVRQVARPASVAAEGRQHQQPVADALAGREVYRCAVQLW